MAKSNVKAIKSKSLNTKSVHHKQSKQSAKLFMCVPVTLSCGLRGWACGDTFVDVINNALEADSIFCP